jgi:hypothetical protein
MLSPSPVMDAEMLVAASEGQGFRYEVVQCADGYLVRSRDLDSGHFSDNESKLFRTAVVALRYAEMAAAFDRCAAARMIGESAETEFAEVEAQQSLFGEISRRLCDDGMEAIMVMAWEQAEEKAARRCYH